MSGYFNINAGPRWGNRRYLIPEYVVFEFFPNLQKFVNIPRRRGKEIELGELADKINCHFPTINSQRIGVELRKFFSLLKNPRAPQDLDPSISSHVQNSFNKDLNFAGRHSFGLPSARYTFTVLAAFAYETASTLLAEVLLSTFWYNRYAIRDQEPDHKLFFWLTALDLLRHLGNHHNLNRCIRFLSNRHHHIRHHYRTSGRFDPQMERLLDKMDRMLQEMDRGRAFDRALAYPRARTLPPVRPVPMLMPAPVPWASAYSSPVVRPYDGWVPEAEMDEMKQRIEDLEINQQVQGMQLGLGPPSPMDALALGWHGLD